MKWFFLVLSITVLLSACGESSEDAYERGYDVGYEDGINAVCYDAERISQRFYAQLRSERVC